MTTDKVLAAIKRLRVETGSLACLGCGHEHDCGIHGCAILREAADLIERLEKEKAALLESLKTSVDSCESCKYIKLLQGCDGFCLDCGSASACSCGTCVQGSKWEWKCLEDNDGTTGK